MAIHRSTALSFLALTVLNACGCGSVGTMERAARDANRQVIGLESEIHAKIKAENKYYSGAINNIRAGGRMARTTDLTDFTTVSARELVRSLGARPNAEALPTNLSRFLDDVIKKWKAREKAREQVLTKLIARLEEGRRELAIEEAKIKALKGKLRALGSARNTKELVKFLAGFSKDISSKVKLLRGAKESGES